MTASLLVLVPVALLVLISGFCFVGCALDTSGIPGDGPPPPFTNYSAGDVTSTASVVAYWPLSEPADVATKPVASAFAQDAVGNNSGNYTHMGNAPDLFPCPGFQIAPGTDTAAAPGLLTLGAVGIVKGDTEQPPATPPVPKTGMQTDGAFVTVPLNAVVNPAPPFTVECWAQPEWAAGDLPAFHMVVDSRDTAGGAFTGFCIDVNEDGNWEAELGIVGASGFVTVTGDKAALNTPTYLALTVDIANTARIFINGNPVGQKMLGASFAANKTQPLIIGAGLRWLPVRTLGGPNLSFPLVPFKGTIQDVAIYDDVLADGVIMKHFSNGMGTPDPET